MDTAARPHRLFVLVREGIIGKALSAMLAADHELDVVADASSLDAGGLGVHRPDVMLVDMDDFVAEFEELLARSRAASPQTRVLALTANGHRHALQRCKDARVDGCLDKDATPGELIRACKTVASGGTYFDAASAQRLQRRAQHAHCADDDLTRRETEILRLVAEGLSNREIAPRLAISEKTVKNHLGRIFAKLQITSRTQAAIYALRSGEM